MSIPTHTRYTAWIATSPSCLDSEYCEVVVLRDEAHGVTFDGEPVWESTTDEVFAARLSVRHDADDDDAVVQEALEILQEAGWWPDRDNVEAVDTGYIVTVEKH